MSDRSFVHVADELDDALDRIAELEAIRARALALVEGLRREHRQGCIAATPSGEVYGHLCTCGAGEHNRRVDELADVLRAGKGGGR